jgi:hypothetical protein
MIGGRIIGVHLDECPRILCCNSAQCDDRKRAALSSCIDNQWLVTHVRSQPLRAGVSASRSNHSGQYVKETFDVTFVHSSRQ